MFTCPSLAHSKVLAGQIRCRVITIRFSGGATVTRPRGMRGPCHAWLSEEAVALSILSPCWHTPCIHAKWLLFIPPYHHFVNSIVLGALSSLLYSQSQHCALVFRCVCVYEWVKVSRALFTYVGCHFTQLSDDYGCSCRATLVIKYRVGIPLADPMLQGGRGPVHKV